MSADAVDLTLGLEVARSGKRLEEALVELRVMHVAMGECPRVLLWRYHHLVVEGEVRALRDTDDRVVVDVDGACAARVAVRVAPVGVHVVRSVGSTVDAPRVLDVGDREDPWVLLLELGDDLVGGRVVTLHVDDRPDRDVHVGSG